jgi:hypothetical protein
MSFKKINDSFDSTNPDAFFWIFFAASSGHQGSAMKDW